MGRVLQVNNELSNSAVADRDSASSAFGKETKSAKVTLLPSSHGSSVASAKAPKLDVELEELVKDGKKKTSENQREQAGDRALEVNNELSNSAGADRDSLPSAFGKETKSAKVTLLPSSHGSSVAS